MKIKLKEHTLFEVLNELTNLYGHGAKRLCVICNDEESLNSNADPLIDGENVTRIGCTFVERDKKLIPVLEFRFETGCKAMKLVDVIRYLERLPVNRNTKVALWMHDTEINYTEINYKYDCKVLDEDIIWNVTVK